MTQPRAEELFLEGQRSRSRELLTLVRAMRDLLLFMRLFSGFGFLTSLRLKAELEECLEKIDVMTSACEGKRVCSARTS